MYQKEFSYAFQNLEILLKEKGIFFLHVLHFGTRKMQVVALLIIMKGISQN